MKNEMRAMHAVVLGIIDRASPKKQEWRDKYTPRGVKDNDDFMNYV